MDFNCFQKQEAIVVLLQLKNSALSPSFAYTKT